MKIAKSVGRGLHVRGLLLAVACALAACGQPATEAPADDVAGAPSDSAGRMASIDADGNIAPFGFASRTPVEIPEPAAPAAAAPAELAVVYSTNCVACHGADATGVQGLGLNLVESQLVAASSEAELIAFLKAGRAADSPDNVTGVPMPAFAWMSDADLTEVAVYVKSLQN